MTTFFAPKGTRHTQIADQVGDRLGCPGCHVKPAETEGLVFIVDTRGRHWCERCVAEVLGEHTRRSEDRGVCYHYTWDTSDLDREPPEPDGEALRGSQAADLLRDQQEEARRLK